jgi:hypothetical protein
MSGKKKKKGEGREIVKERVRGGEERSAIKREG